jgi:hypothetical protein
MKVLRGSSTKDFKVKPWKNSRYGFPALFCATEERLARLYALHRKKQKKSAFGFVHEIEITVKPKEVSFNHRSSFCSEFRNLIYRLYKSDEKAYLITDVFDYPSNELMIHNESDVLVIFDFSIIKSIDLKEDNIIRF